MFDFGYCDDNFKNGISSSTPVEMYINTNPSYSTSDMMCVSFAEVSYDLIVVGGAVVYEEVRPGSGQVYV